MKIPKTDMYAFKVSDYTTILFGQKSKEADEIGHYYYVQRADGTQYKYYEYQLTWVKFIHAT